eukprot:779363-Prymnesium_polylepis.1
MRHKLQHPATNKYKRCITISSFCTAHSLEPALRLCGRPVHFTPMPAHQRQKVLLRQRIANQN